MQPSATASIPPTADMDIQTMQSMDWLFKKERIYLLAQFWQQRATLAEKEVTTLKEQLSSNHHHHHHSNSSVDVKKDGGNMDRQHAYENEMAAKDKEIAQLLEEVQRLQVTITKLQESSLTQITRLEEQLEQKRQQIARLEVKLDVQKDYEEIKRELSIFKSRDLSLSSQECKLLGDAAADKAIESAPEQSPTNDNEGYDGAASKPIETPPPPSSQSIALPPRLPISSPQNALPPPFQNVETFGSLLGEEIVADWRHGPLALSSSSTSTTTSTASTTTTTTTTASTTTLSTSSSSTTTASTTPLTVADSTVKSAASTPQPDLQQPHASPTTLLINGSSNRETPEDNNNLHVGNNNNNNTLPLAQMCAVQTYLRNEDALKGSYRFDDQQPLPPHHHHHQQQQQQQQSHHRSPSFRFADDLGMAPGSMLPRLGESLIPKSDPMEAKLQEMLRYNMDKYASQNLDTLHIARRVRELLSIHNIGQRLFAKYILGLSQGTVSELLSKPKPWDKLTEKGRDSYRKMHAWACDDNAIMLLKSLIPKKGKETGGIPSFGRPDADLTEERIAHILSEASQMQIKSASNNQTSSSMTMMMMEDSRSNDDSKSPHGGCSSPYSKESSQNRRLKKYENDDIPQEKVVRIYQEELAKLMGRRMDDLRNPREQQPFPGIFFPQLFSGGGPMDRTQEEIRIALDAYHREIVKLNQVQTNPSQMPNISLLALQQQALAQHSQAAAALNGGVQDLSLPKEKPSRSENGLEAKEKDEIDRNGSSAGSAFSLVRPKLEPGTAQSQQTGGGGGSTTSSPLGNAILPPAMTPTDDFGTSATASPLQRMASITNSLISQPPTQPHHASSQRPLKAVLPPITQQQFDLYNNLNTEDIVKKVKEQLSQYSISQRLFGESVLGLSQGSVSDLLARPKPWHMLTQKGREPFIRMKMFLEDDNAVHKLVASQYKIAPEKLMRTGGYGGTCTSAIVKPMPPTPKMISEAAGLINKMQQDTQSLLPPSLQLGPPPQLSSGQSSASSSISSSSSSVAAANQQQQQQQQTPSTMLLTPPGVPPHHAINIQNPGDVPTTTPKKPSPHGLVPHSPMGQQPTAMRSLHQHISPSVYEMAALTQDLDTQVITTKIKEALLANNIGQKIFGEAVLGLSQGSVSELLSKPKPWHMLSIKGREPFIRMQLWLNDAHNVDRLQALKNERREANKRRRSSGPGAHDNSSDTSSNDTSEFYHSNSPGPGPPSAKKQRVLFSEEQKEALRLAFALDPYPNVATIEFLANELGLSSRTITNWFHNHRMRLKQQVPHGGGVGGGGAIPTDVPPRDQSGNQAPFDPVQFRLLLNQRLLELSKERLGLTAVPLAYPPYLAANTTNLAALIGRGLLPSAEMDLAALNSAVKEQMSGLDLSMTTLKREPGDYDDEEEDVESNVGSEEDSNMSAGSLPIKGDGAGKEIAPSTTPTAIHQQQQQQQQQQHHHHHHQQVTTGRSSRRKPAAPQWVNPEWQDEKETGKPTTTTAAAAAAASAADEVIINGVCVMQTEDYGRRGAEETVRVEPTPVLDRYEDDRSDDVASSSASETEQPQKETELNHHHLQQQQLNAEDDDEEETEKAAVVKQEAEDERWEY